jgi:hypothetical protein
MGSRRGVRCVKASVNSIPIQFMGTSLKFQSLGIVLDERHTNDMLKKVNFRLKNLSTFRYVLNENVKKGLVDALV